MEDKMLSQEDLKAFRAHLLREEKSPATVEKYLRDAERFCVFARGKPVTKELALEFKRVLQEEGYAVRSVNSMLAVLNSLLEFLGRSECKVKKLRCQRQIYCAEEKELTREEYLRLLAAAARQEQMYLLLQTICATGIRVSELKHFTVEAVTQGDISVRCKNKIRVILVPGKLRQQLLDYAARRGITQGTILVTRGGKPLDRSNIWARMKHLCQAAEVSPSKVYPHNLRKLFAQTFYGME